MEFLVWLFPGFIFYSGYSHLKKTRESGSELILHVIIFNFFLYLAALPFYREVHEGIIDKISSFSEDSHFYELAQLHQFFHESNDKETIVDFLQKVFPVALLFVSFYYFFAITNRTFLNGYSSLAERHHLKRSWARRLVMLVLLPVWWFYRFFEGIHLIRFHEDVRLLLESKKKPVTIILKSDEVFTGVVKHFHDGRMVKQDDRIVGIESFFSGHMQDNKIRITNESRSLKVFPYREVKILATFDEFFSKRSNVRITK